MHDNKKLFWILSGEKTMLRLNLVCDFSSSTSFTELCWIALNQDREALLKYLKKSSLHKVKREGLVEWRPVSYLTFHDYPEAADFLGVYARSPHDKAFGYALKLRYEEAMQLYKENKENSNDCARILKNIASGFALRNHIHLLNRFLSFIEEEQLVFLPDLLFEISRGLMLNASFAGVRELLQRYSMHENSIQCGARSGAIRARLEHKTIHSQAPDLDRLINNAQKFSSIINPESIYYDRMVYDQVFSDNGISLKSLKSIRKHFSTNRELLYKTYSEFAYSLGIGNFPIDEFIQYSASFSDRKVLHIIVESICNGYIEGGHSQELFMFLKCFKTCPVHLLESWLKLASLQLVNKDPLQIWPYIEFIADKFQFFLPKMLNFASRALAVACQEHELYGFIDKTAVAFHHLLHHVVCEALEGYAPNLSSILNLLAYIKKNYSYLLDGQSGHSIFSLESLEGNSQEEKPLPKIMRYKFWEVITSETIFAGSYFIKNIGIDDSMNDNFRINLLCNIILHPSVRLSDYPIQDYFFVNEEKVWNHLFDILEPKKFIVLAEAAVNDAHRAERETLLGQLLRFNSSEESVVHTLLKEAKSIINSFHLPEGSMAAPQRFYYRRHSVPASLPSSSIMNRTEMKTAGPVLRSNGSDY
ncbi:MAG TPA: hypothetical protein VLI69_07140 [Gammaproteobacteria bacterium]|nr:hypothetical protein [Gammaproteobacteria bacterium]